VEDGRYFVVSKGHRYAEVSEARWRVEQFLECSFPWVPVMLVWIGIAFRVTPDMQTEPVPPPLIERPKLTVFLGAVGVVGMALVAVQGWVITGVPWTPVLAAWLALSGSCFVVAWLLARFSRRQSRAEPSSAADCGGMSAFPGV